MNPSNTEWEQLKNNLRSLSDTLGDAIDIDTEFRWVLDGIRRPEPFFRNLHLLLKPESILYFEGCSIERDVCEFYEMHKAPNPSNVFRDTIFPVPKSFHVAFSPDVIARLCELSATRRTSELFDHIKAYVGTSLLIAFHDAFENSCLITQHIAEPDIAEFCVRLGANYHKEPNINKRDPEQMKRLVTALENYQKAIIASEPLWKRFWKALVDK